MKLHDRAEGALHAEVVARAPGSATGRRVVLVHGFTQTGRSWGPVAQALAAAGHDVVLADAPGHGGSGAVRADLPAGAELLGRAGGRAAYVGYSMGGRLCLHLALSHPHLVQRLVLVGATAGIEDPAERAARRAADEALAATLDPVPGEGAGADQGRVDAFLDRWLAGPLFSTLPAGAAGLADRRRNTPDGLAASLRLCGTGTQADLWAALSHLEVPTLVVAGALDPKFSDLGRQLAATIPGGRLSVVTGAGHAVHLEQPEAFISEMLAFLAVGA